MRMLNKWMRAEMAMRFDFRMTNIYKFLNSAEASTVRPLYGGSGRTEASDLNS